jgi:septal ring factor EnvC (AmiA/AmiB activator)
MSEIDTLVRTLPKISLEARGRTYELDIASFVAIDSSNLEKAFVEQSALYAYVATLYAEADHEVKDAKLHLERTEASVNQSVRELLESESGGKRVVNQMVDAERIQHPDVVAAENRLLAAQLNHTMLKGIMEALRIRSEMLISLGAHRRAEYYQAESPKLKDHGKSMRETIKEARDVHEEATR